MFHRWPQTLLLIPLLCLPASEQARGEGDRQTVGAGEPLRLVLELSNGSRIVGVPAITAVKAETSFAKVDLDLRLISTVEFNSGHVGDVAFGRGWRMQGKIDEVMIFNRALSAAEVKQLYDSQKPSEPR